MATGTAARLAAAAGTAPLVQQTALAVVAAVLPLAGLVAMQRLIDAVALGLAGRLAAEAAWHAALSATVLGAAIALAGNVARALTAFVAERHGRRLTDVVTARVQAHAARVPLQRYDEPAFHDLLQRALGEAGQRPVRIVQDTLATLVAGLGLATMVWLLAGVSWWLPGLVAAAALPLAWLRPRHARQRAARHENHTSNQRDTRSSGAVLTGRASAKDVRLLGMAGFWLRRLDGLRQRLRDSLDTLTWRRSRDELAVHTLAAAGLFAAYAWLAHEALAGGLSLGVLVLQAQAAQRAQNGVRDLLGAVAGVHEHRVLLRPLVTFLALPPAGDFAPPPAAPPPPTPPPVALRGLTFRYAEAARDALHAVDLAVAAGEHVAVVGPNGSGKSTLLKLIAGLYAPTAGAIGFAATRPRIAMLSQDAALYELSVRDNLGLGQPAALDDAACWQALALVGLDERVRGLPNGLDAVCSRRHAGGVDWSVGEARRLVLARTLIQPADLLLLDEPFLALDGVRATALAAELQRRAGRTTIVVVDHHPAALAGVDRAVLLDHGALVAAAAPAALAAGEPRFRALFPSAAAR